ncbi:MAG: hypothetical protein WCO98_08090 [bacterium]
MRVIRCPQCKYENVFRSGDVADCTLCGEDLIRCNYCRYQVAGDGCGKAEGVEYFLPNGNGAKNCPHYSSIYQRRGIRVLQFIPAPVWVVSSIIIAFMLLIIMAYSVDPDMRHFRGNEILVDAKVQDNYTGDGEKAVYLYIKNPLQVTSTDITIHIKIMDLYAQKVGDFSPCVAMGKPEITNSPGVIPQKVQLDENGMLLTMYPLTADREYIIKVPFHSLRHGEKSLHLQIFAPREKMVYGNSNGNEDIVILDE